MESDTINKKIIIIKTAQRKRWEIEVGRVFVPMPHESITDMSQFFITRLNGFRSSQSKNETITLQNQETAVRITSQPLTRGLDGLRIGSSNVAQKITLLQIRCPKIGN
jgi:hypothetical protein